jgi:hypothetical protein
MNHSIEYGQAGERSSAAEYQMPAPTVLPLVLAFGLMVAFAGVIFHIYITYLGIAVSLLAAIGWWRKVIPTEEHEFAPLELKHRPSGVAENLTAVARLKAGDNQHRVQIPEEAHSYSSGILGGLAGGIAMAVMACIYGLIAHHSIWFPVNLLAGVVMPSIGAESAEQLSVFDGAAFAAALVGHIGLSVLVGVLYAVTLPMFPKWAFFWAGILMPLIWSGLVATLLNLINPALNSLISWPWYVACQLGFGLVCGYVIARSERIKTMQTWSLAERAHLDASFGSDDKNS